MTDNLICAGLVCPYCGKKTELVDSKEIYGRSYGMAYLCRSCDAYVGCHEGTTKAKGRLANAELREWKKKAHSAFDPIWKRGLKKRSEAYQWLSYALGIPIERTHIGMFDIMECQMTIKLCNVYNV